MTLVANLRPTLRILLGDQLSPRISALADLNPAQDVVLLAEVRAECTYVRHHQQKIVLVLAAMRHFAASLRRSGVRVAYVKLDDPGNPQSLRGEVARAAASYGAARVVATEPGEWRVLADMQGWHEATGLDVEIRPDTRFFVSRRDFAVWAGGRQSLRMEFFYRDMRRRHGVLMQAEQPAGGRWNFDPENRKRLPAQVPVPKIPAFPPDGETREVMAMVAAEFGDHFGRVDGFDWPVTAAQAETMFADFCAHRLPRFGDWQDAMRGGEASLFHARISAALNMGLLDARAVCQAAEAAWRDGRAPLNAVEGFVRQVLGWREFIRGIYWLHMPKYAQRNALGAHRKLPEFYWSGDTGMACLREAVTQTRDGAYAHHIQRLMITGNFALLAGIDPDYVDEWYMIVYADAYEWVEMPNTRGMALFADGGIVGSKPYASGGAYINRMSDYCSGCAYDVSDAVGENACPFNFLYWDFIARHARQFSGNPRLAMPLASLKRMSSEKLLAMRHNAKRFLEAMEAGRAWGAVHSRLDDDARHGGRRPSVAPAGGREKRHDVAETADLSQK
jgi:deoxyribodipyrimidine photolyase-related protein